MATEEAAASSVLIDVCGGGVGVCLASRHVLCVPALRGSILGVNHRAAGHKEKGHFIFVLIKELFRFPPPGEAFFLPRNEKFPLCADHT